MDKQLKNIPKKIYLQIGEDCDCEDFKELSEVSWCQDKIHDNDIEYTRPPKNSKSVGFGKKEAMEWLDKHWTGAWNEGCDDDNLIDLVHKYATPQALTYNNAMLDRDILIDQIADIAEHWCISHSGGQDSAQIEILELINNWRKERHDDKDRA